MLAGVDALHPEAASEDAPRKLPLPLVAILNVLLLVGLVLAAVVFPRFQMPSVPAVPAVPSAPALPTAPSSTP